MTRDRPQVLALCLESVKRPVPKPHVGPMQNFHFGEALAGVYPILDLIFDFLPTDDLKSCSELSQSWGAKAQYALAKRRAPSWFSCYKTVTNVEDKVLHSPNLHYNNADIGIIFYDSCKLKLDPRTFVRLHKNDVEIIRTVREYFEEELIPKSVDYCMLSVHRAISYFSKERSCGEIEFRGSIFDGVFIPKIPSIRTVMFDCNPRKQKTINLHVKPHEETKCLLIFSRSKMHKRLNNLLDRLVPKSSLVALGGGIMKTSKSFQQNHKIKLAHDAICIAFLKDKNSKLDNFNAYSCYIDDPDLSKDEFTVKLAHFKKNIDLKHNSLAFRICCVAKYNGEDELESFEEVFPDLPLASIDARGEFGWNCYPNANVAKEDENRDYPRGEHEYTSVFVIITWD